MGSRRRRYLPATTLGNLNLFTIGSTQSFTNFVIVPSQQDHLKRERERERKREREREREREEKEEGEKEREKKKRRESKTIIVYINRTFIFNSTESNDTACHTPTHTHTPSAWKISKGLQNSQLFVGIVYVTMLCLT